MAAKQKEVKQFVRRVEAGNYAGWHVERISNGYQLKYEGGIGIVTIHGTPSSSRWLKHTETAMRRIERATAAGGKGVPPPTKG